MNENRKFIEVKGIVQGVGFRPFVYNLAKLNNLVGWVNNTSKGVMIDIEGDEKNLNNFINEFKNLEKWEEILLIPLGKAVEEVLIKLKEDGIVKEEQVLMGFPHPSGANVNRVAQFEANRDNMIKFIKKHFI